MLYTIDRVQYSNNYSTYIFFEFMEVRNIYLLLDNNGELLPSDKFRSNLNSMISNVEKEKLRFLMYQLTNIKKYFIFYQRGKKKYIVIESNLSQEKDFSNRKVWNFNELQEWFRKLNNDVGQGMSKELGTTSNNSIDNYVNGILRHLYKDVYFNDDNGLGLTKKLLAGDTTKGIDLDLFQYIPSTDEYIIYEFLKRDNHYINNIEAHPMRYCWKEKSSDNKQKFISLWKIKQYFNARLILVSYSNNPSEKVSLIEVLNLDIDKGITAENKYCMSRNVFLGWLEDMKNYNSNHKDYLSDFKCKHYDSNFFNNFSTNKRSYGSEFTNVYI